ncbi:hypothetical protein KEM48_012654 [Puccinia striiformis f. sp. tritici PST-130]|nr:hypothetical protein KEM48_012654 [Puccinia striiformis f. sp. tritici PST-130]
MMYGFSQEFCPAPDQTCTVKCILSNDCRRPTWFNQQKQTWAQSPPGGPPSDIDIEDDYIPPEQDDEIQSEDDDAQGIDPSEFRYGHNESEWKVMEGWTRKIGLGVKKSLNLMNTIYPPQEAPQDLKGLVGFLQLHPDTLFPVWMSSNPRAVAHHHVSQHVQPSTNNFNHAPGESASLGHP